MRPEDFSPGNVGVAARERPRDLVRGFNEAGGFLPRKRRQPGEAKGSAGVASMRPEDFSPGNYVYAYGAAVPAGVASMRPEDFSPGNM